MGELTLNEKMSLMTDDLLAGIQGTDDNALLCKQALYETIIPDMLMNEAYLYYGAMYKFRGKDLHITADFLMVYLVNNISRVKEGVSSGKITNLAAYASLASDDYRGYILGVVKYMHGREAEHALPIADYRANLVTYRMLFSTSVYEQSLATARTILYDGATIGRDKLQGYEDSTGYMRKSLVDAQAYGVTGKPLVMNAKDLDSGAGDPVEKIGDFGLITELNDSFGGIYSPYFYTVLGQAKGGKSRFCRRMVHNIILAGNNVLAWAPEDGAKPWLAGLRAIHFDYYYNRSGTTTYRGVSKDIISRDAFATDSLRTMESVSKADLFGNTKYGRLYMVSDDAPFELDSFVETLEAYIKVYDIKAVLIDYLQLIQFTGRISKPEAIAKAYQKTLRMAKRNHVAVIVPAQYTQEYQKMQQNLNSVSQSKGGATNLDVLLGGGESAEVTRTVDVILPLYATDEQRVLGRAKILPCRTRVGEVPAIDLDIDLAVEMFSSANATP